MLVLLEAVRPKKIKNGIENRLVLSQGQTRNTSVTAEVTTLLLGVHIPQPVKWIIQNPDLCHRGELI